VSIAFVQTAAVLNTLANRPKARSAVSTDPALPGQPRFCSMFRCLHTELCSPCRSNARRQKNRWSTPSQTVRVAASQSVDVEEARCLGARRPAVNRLIQLTLSDSFDFRNKAERLGFGAINTPTWNTRPKRKAQHYEALCMEAQPSTAFNVVPCALPGQHPAAEDAVSMPLPVWVQPLKTCFCAFAQQAGFPAPARRRLYAFYISL